MDYPNRKKDRQNFLQLLEKLQQDSWQLELLISGFVIFLLIGAYDPLRQMILDGNHISNSMNHSFWYQTPVSILYLGWIFLVSNLFLHIFLRGLWISTIGLRYVSGDVDYGSLKYYPRFTAYLRKRIGTFDRYIERLENICSITFAFTFLIIFVIISMGIYIVFFAFLVNGLNRLFLYFGAPDLAFYFIVTLASLLSLFTLFYFIDFITLGFFKRKKWMYKWYMPIYKLMSVITLSFVYRPIYYNLIDDKFGKWAGYLLVPYIILIALIFSLDFESHPYFPRRDVDAYMFRNDFYDSLRDKDRFIYESSITSPYVKNGYLEIFIRYIPVREDSVLAEVCPTIKPLKRNRLRSNVQINFGNDKDAVEKRALTNDSTYQCLKEIYQLKVNDSIFNDQPLYLYIHPNQEELGLKGILDVDYLPRGEHHFTVMRQQFGEDELKDSLVWEEDPAIFFWKE